jgi:acyl-CoA thioesterase
VASPFTESTSVQPRGAGRYVANVHESWNLRPLPQGGVVSALAVRAMEAELGDAGQRPRTLHTVFAAQVAHGPVEIDVEVLRRGRSMSHLRAEVRNVGSPRGHLTTCVFGAERDGFSFIDLELPDEVPRPDDCRSFRDPLPEGVEPFPPMPFWDTLVEGRPVLGHPPWEDYEPDRAERAMWYRFDETPLLGAGQLDPLGLIVLADTMPGAVGEKVGRQERQWFAPSVDLTVHLLDEWRTPWVLAHNRARHAGHGYASGDMALWDLGDDRRSPPRLVAYATQLFFFTFPRP